MLRVNSDDVLIVPPFEAAWLTDKQFQLSGGQGCVEFGAKGVLATVVLCRARLRSILVQRAACCSHTLTAEASMNRAPTCRPK